MTTTDADPEIGTIRGVPAPPRLAAVERDWEPEAPGQQHVLVVFSVLLLMVLLAALGQTVVVTAMPTMVGELGGFEHLSWVVSAYLLAATVVLPLFGKLGGLIGRRGAFLLAVVVFGVGSFLCGEAETMLQLVAYRAMQGVGAGGLMIGAQAIIADLVPASDQRRYLGLIGATFGLSTIAGPLLGGYLTEQHDWRWVFYVNIPVSVIGLVIIALALRLPRPVPRPKLDVFGTLFLGGASTCGVFVAAWGGTRYTWTDPTMLGLVGGGVLLLVLFVVAERFATAPIIPLRLFRGSIFDVASLIALAIGFAMFGALAYLPLSFQMVNGATPTESALLLLPLVAGIFLGSVFSGRVSSATGHYKVYPIAGTAMAGVGMYLLSRMDEASTDTYNGVATGVLGVGIGLVLPVLVLAVQNSVPPADMGVATSASNYARHIGASVGVALFGALLVSRLGDTVRVSDVSSLAPGAPSAPPPEVQSDLVRALAESVSATFWYGVPVLAAGLVLALFLRQIPLQEHLPGGAHAGAEPVPPKGLRPDHDSSETSNGFLPTEEPMTLPTGPEHTSGLDDANDDRSIPSQRSEHETAASFQADLDHVPADDQIRVFVLQEDGSPIRGAVLTLIDTSGTQVGRSMAAGGGVYYVPTPPAGSYVLVARADFHSPRARLMAVSQGPLDIEVVLGGESGLAGTVHTADGSAIEGATVTLSDAQGSVAASRLTDAYGEYQFDDLLPGSYTLTANAPSLQPSAVSIQVPDSGRIRQDLTLIGGSEIYGTARTQDGERPIPEARITLLDSTGHVLGATTTDSRGHYEFANMTQGEYTVVASCYPPQATTVVVSGGQAVEHDVHLGYPEDA